MAIEKAGEVTYVGQDGADHPLVTSKWYQGFYNEHESVLPEDAGPTPGVLAFWDGDQFLDAPIGEECEMHTYDYLVEMEGVIIATAEIRPPKTPAQRFNDLVLTARKVIDQEMNDYPALKTADACANKAGGAVSDKHWLEAHVWYLMAAGYSFGTEAFKRYETSATDARVLAFAEFAQGAKS